MEKELLQEVFKITNDAYFDLTSNRRVIDEYIQNTIIEKGGLADDDWEKIAMLQQINKIKRMAKNKYKIKIKASNLINANKESLSNPDDDWLDFYEELCSKVSDDAMQDIWARILVKEHIDKGSITKNMLNVFSLMDKKSAIAFQKICSLTYQLKIGGEKLRYIPLVLYSDILIRILKDNVLDMEASKLKEVIEDYDEYLPEQSEIELLDELGLIKMSQVHDESEIYFYEKQTGVFSVLQDHLEMESIYSEQDSYNYILTGQAFFTQLGLALYNALSVEPYENLFVILKNYCYFNQERIDL